MNRSTLLFLFTACLAGCSSESGAGPTTNTSGSGQFKLEAWADNWFSMSLGDKLLVEDSVSIDTERSFNAEIFSFDATYPMSLSFVLKDYKKDDTGLEYIGTDKQQTGDGGFIAQITDTKTGNVVAVSSAAWKCKVIHRAPTNTECEKASDPETACKSEITEEPSGWKDASYDASGWPSAIEYTTTDVSPKEGYDEITWSSDARLIWSASLKQDNTLLCKVTVESP
jgi:hypothetical protein